MSGTARASCTLFLELTMLVLLALFGIARTLVVPSNEHAQSVEDMITTAVTRLQSQGLRISQKSILDARGRLATTPFSTTVHDHQTNQIDVLRRQLRQLRMRIASGDNGSAEGSQLPTTAPVVLPLVEGSFSLLSPEDKLMKLRLETHVRMHDTLRLFEMRRQPAFPIVSTAGQSPRQVIQLSVPRSGSTLIMSLFSLIEDAFVLPEPYNMFEVNVTLPWFMNKGAKVPSLSSLLDCSFIFGDAMRNVFWDYACKHIQWIVRDPLVLEQCLIGSMYIDATLRKCMSSKLRLVKLARLPFLTKQFPDESLLSLIPNDARVINLVRAPWDTFVSQYMANWFSDTQLPYKAMVPSGEDPMRFHMDRICKHTLLHCDLADSLGNERAMTIRYEDIVNDFDASTRRILEYLGVDVTQELLGVAQRIQKYRFAQFVGLLPAQLTFNKADAERLAMQLPSCRDLVARFNYATSSSSSNA